MQYSRNRQEVAKLGAGEIRPRGVSWQTWCRTRLQPLVRRTGKEPTQGHSTRRRRTSGGSLPGWSCSPAGRADSVRAAPGDRRQRPAGCSPGRRQSARRHVRALGTVARCQAPASIGTTGTAPVASRGLGGSARRPHHRSTRPARRAPGAPPRRKDAPWRHGRRSVHQDNARHHEGLALPCLPSPAATALRPRVSGPCLRSPWPWG
jgi:hypothetical protein